MEADARHAVDCAKSALAVLAAKIRFEVQDDPGRFGLDPGKRPTVDDLAAAVTTDPRHVAAVRALADLDRDHGHLRADTLAMVDRRKALERLVELVAMDYHAEQEPKPLSPAAAEHVRRKIARPVGRGGIDPDE